MKYVSIVGSIYPLNLTDLKTKNNVVWWYLKVRGLEKHISNVGQNVTIKTVIFNMSSFFIHFNYY